MIDAIRSVLKQPPRLPPVLLWLALAASLLGLLPLLVQVGYNLAAPLFRSPWMTYGEAFGLTILAALVVGMVALLKE